MGMQLRNVTTIGDRSAAGLSEISGVWVVVVPGGTMLSGIFQANDVILEANGRKISNASDLRKAFNDNEVDNITFTISRNQKEQKVHL